MTERIQKIKNWISDLRFRSNHDRNANRLNSELEKNYYKSNSTDIIKILTELDKKAGLSSYDIVPFLKEIKRMPFKGVFIEKGSSGKITDRHRNDELFNELEELEFIRIIENKLFSVSHGQKYKTPAEECILKVKLLPKGIDYLTEHNKRKRDYRFAYVTIVLLFITFLVSIPQACNNWAQYKNLTKEEKPGNKENSENNKTVTNKLKNDASNSEIKTLESDKVNLMIKPISDTTKH